MKEITVSDRQNALDLALQEYGNAVAVFDLALANGRGITEVFTAGDEITLPESRYSDPDVMGYYHPRKIKPVTADTINNAEPAGKGIGTMSIKKTFIIA